tara:strand:+ start:85 stop:204 length:120 start_codon:yes stop_codon:yes gene_type:complete
MLAENVIPFDVGAGAEVAVGGKDYSEPRSRLRVDVFLSQ